MVQDITQKLLIAYLESKANRIEDYAEVESIQQSFSRKGGDLG